MNNLNVVGVDLAKTTIQVSVITPTGKELQNKALMRKKFSAFLARQKESLIEEGRLMPDHVHSVPRSGRHQEGDATCCM